MTEQVRTLRQVPTDTIPPGLPRQVERAIMKANDQGYATVDVEIRKDAAGVQVRVIPMGTPAQVTDGSFEVDSGDTEGGDADGLDEGAQFEDDEDCAVDGCLLPVFHDGDCVFEERKHSGAMIALFPVQVPEGLALGGGEKPEDLHITLAYIAPETMNETVRTTLIAAAARVALSRVGTLSGKVAGYGRFIGTAGDADAPLDAYWASVDVPGLANLRQAVVAAIPGLCEQTHDYTPHMTLAYLDPVQVDPAPPPAGSELIFTALSVCIGDERIDLPFPVDTGGPDWTEAPNTLVQNDAAGADGPTVTSVHTDTAMGAYPAKYEQASGTRRRARVRKAGSVGPGGMLGLAGREDIQGLRGRKDGGAGGVRAPGGLGGDARADSGGPGRGPHLPSAGLREPGAPARGHESGERRPGAGEPGPISGERIGLTLSTGTPVHAGEHLPAQATLGNLSGLSDVRPSGAEGAPGQESRHSAEALGAPFHFTKSLERRYTLSPWYVPNSVDGHGHWTDANTLQEALWGYVQTGNRQVYLQHNQKVVAGEWVEILTWPVPVRLPLTVPGADPVDQEFPAGTVFIGIIWRPWAWDLIKTGKVTGISIGGKAVVEEGGPVVEEVEGAYEMAASGAFEQTQDGTPVRKANPYHDRLGRFASKGAAGGGSVAPEADHARRGGRVGMGDLAMDQTTVAELRMHGQTSRTHITPEGRFTPERQALHDKIVEEHLAGVSRSADPQFHMLGGGPAAGKSTALAQGRFAGVPGKDKAVQVDTDRIKEMLPETAGMRADGDMNWANKSHMESMYLARRVQLAAVERGMDVVFDGTGDSKPHYITEKIHAARANGYKVKGHYVTTSIDQAMAQATRRGATTGRVLHPAVVENIHRGVSYTLPRVAHEFDAVDLVDMGRGGKVIARATRGSGLKPVGGSEGAKALKEFLDKAGDYTP